MWKAAALQGCTVPGCRPVACVVLNWYQQWPVAHATLRTVPTHPQRLQLVLSVLGLYPSKSSAHITLDTTAMR